MFNCMEIIEIDGRNYVDARSLYEYLGIKRRFTDWVRDNINRAMLSKSDFITSTGKSTGGRPSAKYYLTRDAGLAFILMSGGKNAAKVRKEFIRVWDEKETGLSFTHDQISALIDLSKCMCLVSIQQDVERKHFDIYNNKYTWYQYRAGLLGYSTETIIKAMRSVNKKHKSIRKSLVHLDSNELIRTGVIDFMKVLGKTDEYAKNVGNLCKDISEKMELGRYVWDDTKEDKLGLNDPFVEARKKIYHKYDRGLNK